MLKHENVFSHITSGLVAFIIGFLLHRSAVWRGGDAKLFALYSLLMPEPIYKHIIFPNVVNLFACSFISGTIILLPIFIKDIIMDHKIIANELFKPEKREALFVGFMSALYYSWILFPFYYLARTANPVIILTIIYLFFTWIYKSNNAFNNNFVFEFLKKHSIILLLGLVSGTLMRFLLSPASLSYLVLTRYFIAMIFSMIISTCLYTTLNHFKNYQERVPFAPLLLIGCFLSYTPFLTNIIQMVTRWNVLLYR